MAIYNEGNHFEDGLAVFLNEEIARYKRHLLVKEIGGQGQQRLKAARVLIVGAGGLGSPLILYLAAAGVGTLGIIDDDTVSLDNLQRQVAFRTADQGTLKVKSAADACRSLNPHVTVETMPYRLTAGNATFRLFGHTIATPSDSPCQVTAACSLSRLPMAWF